VSRQKHVLFTIGYEDSTLEKTVATLQHAAVKTLIDVRAIAASRRPGFAKQALSKRLERAGIAYVHLRDLGTPKPGRDAAKIGDIDTMKIVYRDHLKKPEVQFALVEAIDWAQKATSCLLCLERDHNSCHRSIVAGVMAKKGEFEIKHLGDEASWGVELKLRNGRKSSRKPRAR
jgi:uncharacterized protein (DUF488 family)